MQEQIHSISKIIQTITIVLMFFLLFIHKGKNNSSNSKVSVNSEISCCKRTRQEVFYSVCKFLQGICLFILFIYVTLFLVKRRITFFYTVYSISYFLFYVTILYKCFKASTEHDLYPFEINALSSLSFFRFIILRQMDRINPIISNSQSTTEAVALFQIALNYYIDTFLLLTVILMIVVSVLRRLSPNHVDLIKIKSRWTFGLHHLYYKTNSIWINIILILPLFLADFVRNILGVLYYFCISTLNYVIAFYNTVILKIWQALYLKNDTVIIRLTSKVAMVAALSMVYIVIIIDGGYSEKVVDLYSFFSTVLIIPVFVSAIDNIKSKLQKDKNS